MQGVFGLPYQPPRNRTRSPALSGLRVAGGFVASVLGAVVLAALTLHLLTQMAGHLSFQDPVGTLAAMGGMAVVLLLLLPFTALCARRAHSVWVRGSEPR